MRYLRTMKATEFKFQELEFSASRTKVKFFRLRRRLEQEDKKIALRKLSRKSETARRDVINIPTKRKQLQHFSHGGNESRMARLGGSRFLSLAQVAA